MNFKGINFKQQTRRFAQSLFGWLAVLSILVSSASAVYLYFFTSGARGALLHSLADSSFTAWQIKDLQSTLGLFGVLNGFCWLVLSKFENQPAQRRLRWTGIPWTAVGAGIIVVWGSFEVLEEHPVLVDSPRMTEFPATLEPDKIALSVSEDPARSVSIQWRTAVHQRAGQVRFRPLDGTEWTLVPARTTAKADPLLVNDPIVHRHTARLNGLDPDKMYEYQVGHESKWSAIRSFSTAPGLDAGFRFIYMGDPQNGLASWGELLRSSHRRHPDAAFYAIAGDLVDGGDSRDQWDVFFSESDGVFDRIPIAPAIGNHETSAWGGPWMYLENFDLPKNGPSALTPERAYYFDVGAARFMVLDTETSIPDQKDWVETVLADNDRPWTIAMFHRPAYSSRPDRDNPQIREEWVPLFDQYGVDLVLQGHDHAYKRTWPMRDHAVVQDNQEGTTYVVAVSGTKYYAQAESALAARAFTALSTYQVIDVTPTELRFKAFTVDGSIVDEFRIEKNDVSTMHASTETPPTREPARNSPTPDPDSTTALSR